MPTSFIIRDGDCLLFLADKFGFLPQTIWDDPANATLKEKRKSMEVLLPGDSVTIPDKTPKEVQKPSEATHRFRRKGSVARLRVRFLQPSPPAAPSGASAPPSISRGGGISHHEEPLPDGFAADFEPRAGVPFVLNVSGTSIEGTTDGQGLVDEPIPPTATEAEVTFHPGTRQQESVVLAVGSMDPEDEVVGLRKRLNNLGYRCNPTGAAGTADLVAAVRAFQTKNPPLDPNGTVNDATRDRIKEVHGC